MVLIKRSADAEAHTSARDTGGRCCFFGPDGYQCRRRGHSQPAAVVIAGGLIPAGIEGAFTQLMQEVGGYFCCNAGSRLGSCIARHHPAVLSGKPEPLGRPMARADGNRTEWPAGLARASEGQGIEYHLSCHCLGRIHRSTSRGRWRLASAAGRCRDYLPEGGRHSSG